MYDWHIDFLKYALFIRMSMNIRRGSCCWSALEKDTVVGQMKGPEIGDNLAGLEWVCWEVMCSASLGQQRVWVCCWRQTVPLPNLRLQHTHASRWLKLALHITSQRTNSMHGRLAPIPDPFICPTTVSFSKAQCCWSKVFSCNVSKVAWLQEWCCEFFHRIHFNVEFHTLNPQYTPQ